MKTRDKYFETVKIKSRTDILKHMHFGNNLCIIDKIGKHTLVSIKLPNK